MTTAQESAATSPASSPASTPPSTSTDHRTGTSGRRIGLLILLALIIGLGAAWYLYGPHSRPHVVLITSGDGPYWDPVIAGAEEAAREFDVKLVVDRVKSDPYVQSDVIQKRAAERGVDGIAISPLNASSQANLLADVAGSTTLVTLDSDSPVTGRLCFVGTDNYAAGREAGENVRAAIPDGGDVILCLGNPEKENTLHRRQGVIDELLDRDHVPNRTPDGLDKPIKGERYTIVATLVDGSDPARATELATTALKDHPNVKCFVGLLGYSTPAVLAALETSGKLGGVKLVGFDVDDRTTAAIDAGHVYATIMQDQRGCGYHAVRILAGQARGVKGGLPLFQVHALPYRTIRKDNLADARGDGPAPPAAPPTTSTAAAGG